MSCFLEVVNAGREAVMWYIFRLIQQYRQIFSHSNFLNCTFCILTMTLAVILSSQFCRFCLRSAAPMSFWHFSRGLVGALAMWVHRRGSAQLNEGLLGQSSSSVSSHLETLLFKTETTKLSQL